MKMTRRHWQIVACALGGAMFIFPWWPAGLVLLVYLGLDALGAQVWPAVLDVDERGFLTALWLVGLTMLAAALLACRAKKDKRYLWVCGAGVLSLTLVTLLNLPLSAQESRRWQVAKELRYPPWTTYRASAVAAVNAIEGSAARNAKAAQQTFDSLASSFDALPRLSYLPEDAAQAEQLWRRAAGGADDARLKAYAAWLVDRPEVMMSTAITAMAQGRGARSGFLGAVMADPRRGDAWRGLALQEIQGITGGYDVTPALGRALGALAQAERLGQGTPPLSVRFDAMRHALPGWIGQTYAILEARTKLAMALEKQEEAAPAVAALAAQGLPLPYPLDEASGYISGSGEGRVSIDYARHAILPDSVRAVAFPLVRDHIGHVTVLLSIDVNAAGEPVFISVVQGSQYAEVERTASRAALTWRFAPAGKPERRLVPVEFIDSRMNWDQYYASFDDLIQKLSLRAARVNMKETDDFAGLLRAFRDKNIPEKRSNTSRDSATGRDIVRDAMLRRHNISSPQSWESALDELRQLYATYPRDGNILHRLATMEFGHYLAASHARAGRKDVSSAEAALWRQTLLSSRQHFARLIAQEPGNIRGWHGWAMSWVDEDIELAAGALVISRQLILRANWQEWAGLVRLQERMLTMRLPEASHQRLNIVMARMAQRYRITLPDENSAEHLARRDRLAAQVVPGVRPFPAEVLSRSPAARKNIMYFGAARGRVDFDSAGVSEATRVPPRMALDVNGAPAEGSVHVQIDVDAGGVPQLVMVTQSSGAEMLDQSAVDAAWQWRFTPAREGKRVDVPIGFKLESLRK